MDEGGDKKEEINKKKKGRAERAGGKNDQVDDEGNGINDRQAEAAENDKKNGEKGDGLGKETDDRGERQ